MTNPHNRPNPSNPTGRFPTIPDVQELPPADPTARNEWKDRNFVRHYGMTPDQFRASTYLTVDYVDFEVRYINTLAASLPTPTKDQRFRRRFTKAQTAVRTTQTPSSPQPSSSTSASPTSTTTSPSAPSPSKSTRTTPPSGPRSTEPPGSISPITSIAPPTFTPAETSHDDY